MQECVENFIIHRYTIILVLWCIGIFCCSFDEMKGISIFPSKQLKFTLWVCKEKIFYQTFLFQSCYSKKKHQNTYMPQIDSGVRKPKKNKSSKVATKNL